MNFSAVSRSYRIFAGTNFSLIFPVHDSMGSPALDSDLANWTFTALVKRSPDHENDDPESFIPVVSRVGPLLTVTGDKYQTESLRDGRMCMWIFADNADQRQIVATADLHVERF